MDPNRAEVTYAFLLLHEFAHKKLGHKKVNTKEEDDRQELEADRYSVDQVSDYYKLKE